MRASPGQAQREFERLAQLDSDDCILWPYTRLSNGYGQVSVDRKMQSVHRLACERHHGPPPFEGAQACHSCRNRHCMNYRHLRWAACSENMADKLRDGTEQRGERHSMVKLTESQVREIRRRIVSGESQRDIAADFGINQTQVSKINVGRAWGWLR